MREEAVVADRADPDVDDGAVAELRAGDLCQVEVATVARVVLSEVLVDFFTHLVATAAGAGADRGGDRAGAADLAQRFDAFGEDAAGERAPAAVQRGDGALGGQQDR